MNILFYVWTNTMAQDVIDSLTAYGHNVIFFADPLSDDDYDNDPVLSQKLNKILDSQSFDVVFTFNYIPLISNITCRRNIRYISWVYDCPHNTLYSKSIHNPNNRIYIFDRVLYHEISQFENQNVVYCPLAVATERLDKQLGFLSLSEDMLCSNNQPIQYVHDVSFLGSLYGHIMYDKVKYLPDYEKGFIDGIMKSQEMLYGINLANEIIDDRFADELCKYISFSFGDTYYDLKLSIIRAMVNMKISQVERKKLLIKVANQYPLDYYGSNSTDIPNCKAMGYAEYYNEMPKVFRHSKINLNITIRSITSGIPLRALDIMGAGGFLLSNYQPELAEYFENGVDCVMFDSPDNMMELIDYYLKNEKERASIAYNGYCKAKKLFDYNNILPQIISGNTSVSLFS